MNIIIMDLVEIANEVDLGRSRTRNLSSRLRNSALNLSDGEFKKSYRLSKSLARNLISELAPYMPVKLRSDALDTDVKILVALGFFATGSYQTLVGQTQCHSMSQFSVSRAIHQVTDVLNMPHIFNKYVRFPTCQEDRDNIKRAFYNKFRLPGVLGCIDGTHVAIVKPTEHEERYFSRKGYHSLNTLIICDSDARILCVDSSNPGSMHDSAAWSNNPIKATLEQIVTTSADDFYLLGDSGFPLRRVMMTPILHTAPNTPEAFYNQKHMTARSVVERCIGILKARFRCLLVDRKLHYKPRSAAKIINACCVLHNIALTCEDPGTIKEEMAILEIERLERERDGHNDGARLAARDHRSQRSNDPLQQGRNYQNDLVERLWRGRQN